MDRYSEKVKYEQNQIGETVTELLFESRWVSTPFPNNPLWRRMGAVFDPEHFLYPSPPVDLGKVDIDVGSLEGTRVLRCPIKKPGSRTVLLPTELAPMTPFVRFVCETEAFANQHFEEFWCHITFENTYVEAKKTQRVAGWHVDGFQGTRVARHRAEHSYLWATSKGAEFCLQPFFVSHLDPTRHNLFNTLAEQAQEVNSYQGIARHVYLIDPYIVHRSPWMDVSGQRSIARITFTETELEDPTNTRNLSLGQPQDYAPRIDVRDRLSTYDGEIPWAQYGIKG